MADLKLTVDYSQVKAANKEIVQIGGSAKKSASVFEAAFKKAEAQQKKSLNSLRQQIAFSKKMEVQKAKEAKVTANAAVMVAKEEERLKNKFVEGYTAMNIYTKELNDLALARKKDILSADGQKAAVAQLNAQMKAGTGVFANAATGMQVVGKRANRTGVLAQQAGYQFGDFAVQVQSGTNVMVAAGQQATQLIGTFSMLAKSTRAIMAFSALGVLVPIITGLAAAFMRSKKASDEASESIKGLDDRLKSARSSVQSMKEELALLQSGFENLAILNFSDGVKEAEKALTAAQSKVALTEKLLGNISFIGGKRRREEAKLAIKNAKTILEHRKEELAEAINTAEMLQIHKDLQGQTAMILEGMLESQEAARDKAVSHLETVEDLEEKYGEATVAAFRLMGVPWEDMAARLSGVADQAGRLASNLEAARSFGTTAGGEFAAVPTGLDPFGGAGPNIADSRFTNKSKTKTKGGSSKKSPAEEFAEYLDGLKKQAELEKQLVGLFDEKRAEEEAVIQARQKYGEVFGTTQEAELRGTLAQIEADKERQRVLEEAKAQQEQLASMIAGEMGDAFMSIVDGTKSVKDAFKDMARAIIKELYQVFVVKKITGFIEGFVGGLGGSSLAPTSSVRPQIRPHADGGVVGGPTYFPMAGGKTGLMGEAGPEAIMPLKRGANGKLGVQMEGGSQGNVVVNQSFNFSANGDDSVKKLIAQAAPKIAQMTKSSLLDDRRRGGSTKAAFG
ncbi:hypothetical protein OAI16_06730 [Flavobacteriaceae bacterium]|nr:hypothetical protein [Flavobacteriaceae bacterium]